MINLGRFTMTVFSLTQVRAGRSLEILAGQPWGACRLTWLSISWFGDPQMGGRLQSEKAASHFHW